MMTKFAAFFHSIFIMHVILFFVCKKNLEMSGLLLMTLFKIEQLLCTKKIEKRGRLGIENDRHLN